MEKKQDNIVEMLGYLIIGLAVGIPIQIYTAWIVLKAIEWYHIPVSLSLVQLWVIIVIFKMLKSSPDTTDGSFPELLKAILKQVGPLSFLLGIIYLMGLIWN